MERLNAWQPGGNEIRALTKANTAIHLMLTILVEVELVLADRCLCLLHELIHEISCVRLEVEATIVDCGGESSPVVCTVGSRSNVVYVVVYCSADARV